MKIIVTGGAGFIGSAVVRHLIAQTEAKVLNVDKLTYSANLSSLEQVVQSPRYSFLHADICDYEKLVKVLEDFQPTAIMHLAAESHVDRSIDGPAEFIQTNVVGTCSLLEAARRYWETLKASDRESFRFLHISTDEVYGDLTDTGDFFTEQTPYAPSSPYAASKASSDHLVRAWHRTFGLPTMITNCSNNYGPYQFPEKLIPLMVINALNGKSLPVYGDGKQVRDWLYVDDHARALWTVLTKGKVGSTYNVGGNNEKANIDVVSLICDTLTQLTDPPPQHENFKDLIEFVVDRPGHDTRYAIDASKIETELAWKPIETFESGIAKTIEWYLDNEAWWAQILKGGYNTNRLGRASSK